MNPDAVRSTSAFLQAEFMRPRQICASSASSPLLFLLAGAPSISRVYPAGGDVSGRVIFLSLAFVRQVTTVSARTPWLSGELRRACIHQAPLSEPPQRSARCAARSICQRLDARAPYRAANTPDHLSAMGGRPLSFYLGPRSFVGPHTGAHLRTKGRSWPTPRYVSGSPFSVFLGRL